MNEKLQYASMLEMPFSTANVTAMPTKKKRKKVNHETVKQELIQKVNAQEEGGAYPEYSVNQEEIQGGDADSYIETTAVVPAPKKSRFKNFKISVIGVQIAVVGALVATIFLTSAINPNSGINTFFKSAFATPVEEVVDERLHQEFAPVIALEEGEYAIENGIMTMSATGSIYSPCDGQITSIAVDGNGKYTVEIEHSKNFKSQITGLDYIYGEKGATVFSNIPVGYMNSEGATLCFTGADGAVISNYEIVDNSVVWAV